MGLQVGAGSRRGLAASVRVVAFGAVAWMSQATARAQPADAGALAAARSLFAEALHDEDAGRPADALRKFERVRDVRDTAPVEYRIGTCDETLGDMPAAYVAYRAAIALGQGDAASVDVVRAAVDRLDALAALVARVTVTLPEPLPPDVEVRLDDAPLARATLAQAIPVKPGAHVVTATAGGWPPFRATLVVQAGGQASLAVPVAAPSAALQAEGAPARPASTSRTVGLVLAGGSVPLFVAAVAFLVAREADVSGLRSACPGGHCPPGADSASLDSTRGRALAEGPAAAALGITGAAMAVAGTVLLLASRPSPEKPSGAAIALGPAGVACAGWFP